MDAKTTEFDKLNETLEKQLAEAKSTGNSAENDGKVKLEELKAENVKLEEAMKEMKEAAEKAEKDLDEVDKL